MSRLKEAIIQRVERARGLTPIAVISNFSTQSEGIPAQDAGEYQVSELDELAQLVKGLERVDSGIHWYAHPARRASDNQLGTSWGIVVTKGGSRNKVGFADRLRRLGERIDGPEELSWVHARSMGGCLNDEDFYRLIGEFKRGLQKGINYLETGEFK